MFIVQPFFKAIKQTFCHQVIPLELSQSLSFFVTEIINKNNVEISRFRNYIYVKIGRIDATREGTNKMTNVRLFLRNRSVVRVLNKIDSYQPAVGRGGVYNT